VGCSGRLVRAVPLVGLLPVPSLQFGDIVYSSMQLTTVRESAAPVRHTFEQVRPPLCTLATKISFMIHVFGTVDAGVCVWGMPLSTIVIFKHEDCTCHTPYQLQTRGLYLPHPLPTPNTRTLPATSPTNSNVASCPAAAFSNTNHSQWSRCEIDRMDMHAIGSHVCWLQAEQVWEI
jgi:hypothetical protein